MNGVQKLHNSSVFWLMKNENFKNRIERKCSVAKDFYERGLISIQ